MLMLKTFYNLYVHKLKTVYYGGLYAGYEYKWRQRKKKKFWDSVDLILLVLPRYFKQHYRTKKNEKDRIVDTRRIRDPAVTSQS
jgi:hypothetical protein